MGFVLLISLLFLQVLKLLSVIKMLHHCYSNGGRSQNISKTCLCCKTFQDDVQGPPSLPFRRTPWPQCGPRIHSTVLLALRNKDKKKQTTYLSPMCQKRDRMDQGMEGGTFLLSIQHLSSMCSHWKASRIGSLLVFCTLGTTWSIGRVK